MDRKFTKGYLGSKGTWKIQNLPPWSYPDAVVLFFLVFFRGAEAHPNKKSRKTKPQHLDKTRGAILCFPGTLRTQVPFCQFPKMKWWTDRWIDGLIDGWIKRALSLQTGEKNFLRNVFQPAVLATWWWVHEFEAVDLIAQGKQPSTNAVKISRKIFKQPKNREDSSDFDDCRTKSIESTRTKIRKLFERTNKQMNERNERK